MKRPGARYGTRGRVPTYIGGASPIGTCMYENGNTYGKGKASLTVGCTPHRQINGGKRIRQRSVWVAHRVIIILLALFSPSTHSLHTPSTLQFDVRVDVVAGAHGCCCSEVVVGWCMGLLSSTSLPWLGPHMGIDQGAQRRQWMAARWW